MTELKWNCSVCRQSVKTILTRPEDVARWENKIKKPASLLCFDCREIKEKKRVQEKQINN